MGRSRLAAGKTEDQIIEDCPELKKGDFGAVYDYAARMERGLRSVKLFFAEHLSTRPVAALAGQFFRMEYNRTIDGAP